MNHFLNLKKTILVFLSLSFIAVSFLNIVSAVTLSDPDDDFRIVSPSANSTVRGTIEIIADVYDDDQSQIQYTASLFDTASCNNTFYGSISGTSTFDSNEFATNSITWNTTTTSTNSFLADGEYCIKICVSMLNGNSPYSACSARRINILNNNLAPTINSFPSRLEYTEGETFNYDINASDPENDALRYRFLITPDFLSINQSTGQITSSQLTSSGNSVASYPVRIGVSDGINGEVFQEFNITVSKAASTDDSNTSTGTTSDATTGSATGSQTDPNGGKADNVDDSNNEMPDDALDEITENIYGFEFINPSENEVIVDDAYTIYWQLESQRLEELTNLTLEYSSDLENWTQIGEDITTDRVYYLWQLENLVDDSYFLRMNIFNDSNEVLRISSNEFEVDRIEEQDDSIVEDPESIPLIINFSPEDREVITDESNLIFSADFIPSEGQTINAESAEIQFNGRIYNENCTIEEAGFTCTIEEPVEGRQLVSVSVEDSSLKQANAEWSFEIDLVDNEGPGIITETLENSADESGDTVSIFGNVIPRSTFILALIILCIGSIILVVPWLLYALWGNRNKDNSTEVVVKDDSNQNLNPNALPTINTYTDIYTPPENNNYDSNVANANYETPVENYPVNNYDYSTQNYDQQYTSPTSDTGTNVDNYLDTNPDENQSGYDYAPDKAQTSINNRDGALPYIPENNNPLAPSSTKPEEQQDPLDIPPFEQNEFTPPPISEDETKSTNQNNNQQNNTVNPITPYEPT